MQSLLHSFAHAESLLHRSPPPHAETIEHRLYRQALAAEGLAHGVKFTLAGAVSISAFHRAHFALEGLFSDDAGG
jgi:hypothetical protein